MVAEQVRVTETKGIDEVDVTTIRPSLTSGSSVRLIEIVVRCEVVPLEGRRYPVLVSVWDNDDDALYDQV